MLITNPFYVCFTTISFKVEEAMPNESVMSHARMKFISNEQNFLLNVSTNLVKNSTSQLV
jgi:hypothetical protein